jgi:hypothetical protein
MEQPAYPSGLIGATRLMAAVCMFSAMAAVLRFEATTLTGRLLAITSVMVAFAGQLFALQGSKPQPAAWALALLPMFWIGVAVLVIMWLVALA